MAHARLWGVGACWGECDSDASPGAMLAMSLHVSQGIRLPRPATLQSLDAAEGTYQQIRQAAIRIGDSSYKIPWGKYYHYILGAPPTQ
jgi:hypothetical protein